MSRLLLAAMAWCLLLACGSDPGSGPPQPGTGGGSAGGGGAGTTGAGGAGPAAGGAGGGGGVSTAGAAGSGAESGAGGAAGNAWGATQCAMPASNLGFELGDSIGALELLECETGAKATLDELCGAAATWIFVAHTHCPTCKATASFTSSVAQKVTGDDVAIAHIVYDDNGTSCATWKQAYELGGLSNVRVYEDPTGAAWSKLKSSNLTAPSVFLDGDRRITFKAHALTESAVLSRIDEALMQ